ncbi:MAG: threonyl-tRNA synthetase editing domain-containing protein, partial [Thermoproteota archaeon]
MRILQLHCDNIEYSPIKKEISSAEDIDPKPKRFEEIVVAFVAVEEGDDKTVAANAILQIKDSMKKIGCQ